MDVRKQSYAPWTATDDCGNSTARTQTITTNDTTDPVLTGVPADLTLECGTNPPAPATPGATDNCDPNVAITYDQTSEIDGCTETITRTWTATDDCGNSAVATQVITITDMEAPVITPVHPDLIGVSDGDTLIFDCLDSPLFNVNDVTVSDNCDDNPDVIFVDNGIMLGDCIEDGYIVKMNCFWKATDECGNMSQFDIVILIRDDNCTGTRYNSGRYYNRL
jgi:hypothetical protein